LFKNLRQKQMKGILALFLDILYYRTSLVLKISMLMGQPVVLLLSGYCGALSYVFLDCIFQVSDCVA
jgi:hypothetical protein